jgi:hypothetical protein
MADELGGARFGSDDCSARLGLHLTSTSKLGPALYKFRFLIALQDAAGSLTYVTQVGSSRIELGG